ncbi:MAG: protein kinase [Clostridia bacterium]|nr:protein kinase [Clostridia bacterium]
MSESIEPIRGYAIEGDWHQANEGHWAHACKDGKDYFLKQYTNVAVEPDRSKIGVVFNEATYNLRKEEFDLFKRRKDRLNSSLRRIAGFGGNIVIPLDAFVHDHYYTEVSNFYPDMLSEEEIIALPFEQKQLLMVTMTDTLSAVHNIGIVHSDVKGTNVICTKNALGKYVLKLIDFGASYFVDDRPVDSKEYSGDPTYASPELGMVWMCEDAEVDPTEYIAKLTQKSDIFSLGILFHFFLTGERPIPTDIDLSAEFPGRDTNVIYPFEVILHEGKLGISSAITDPKYKEIIPKMLDADPDKRPSAGEVLRCIRGMATPAPAAPAGAGARPSPAATPRPAPAPTPAPRPVSVEVDDPRPEDAIAWVDNIKALMSEKGYTKLKRDRNFLGANSYTFVTTTGSKIMLSKENMVDKGFAVAVAPDTSDYGDTDDILRAEDKALYKVNTEYLRAHNIVIRPMEKTNAALGRTVVGYELMNTVTNVKNFTAVATMVLTKYLLRK